MTAGVLQVAPTRQGTQGLLGALTAPEIEFYEHPDGAEGVGICLWMRGEILLQRRPVVPGDAGLRPELRAAQGRDESSGDAGGQLAAGLGRAFAQFVANLVGRVGAALALRPRDHHSGGRDPDQPGNAQHLPPSHST